MAENKLIAQVNHRTLATLMTVATTVQVARYLGLAGLTRPAKLASVLLIAALWGQLYIGVLTIWQSVPIHLASAHQIGAMTVLSSFLFAMHTCRRVDPRHLKNLMGKLRMQDPKRFEAMMSNYNSKVLTKRQYQALRQ